MLTKNQQKQLETLGANIRRERMRQKMTQERLAEQVDLHLRTVQKIEAGETNVLTTTLIRFQRALKCDWSRLLPGE